MRGLDAEREDSRAFCMTVTLGPAPGEAALSARRNPVLRREFMQAARSPAA